MIMKSLFLFTVFSCVTFTTLSQNYTKALKGLDKELEQVLDTWGIAGFSVAVVDQNGIIYEKGFGYRNKDEQIKADEHTMYAIGSCTKAFTSALIGQLDHEELLDINNSPREYVDYFSFFNDEMDNQLTIHDIMCHRSGLPRHDLAWYFFPSDSKEELVKRIAHHEPTAGVREVWQYNNFMFLLQGVITEEITGNSWEENIETRLFAPLEMKESVTRVKEFKNSANAAVGYAFDDSLNLFKKEYYEIAGMSPAGSIASSVHDMSKWVQLWINGGILDKNEIIPPLFAQAAISSQMSIGNGLPSSEHPDLHMSSYGYGWMSGSYKGHYRVAHGGNIDGFSANTCFFPTDSIGIIVLCNQDGSGVPSVVRNIISDRLLNVDRDDWNQDLYDSWLKSTDKSLIEEGNNEARVENTNPSHKLSEYSGMYKHPGYGEFEIQYSNDVLTAHFPRLSMKLEHYHYDVFELKPIDPKTADMGLKVNFTSDMKGDISALHIPTEAGLDPMEFKRKPIEAKLDESVLTKYVGKYTIQGVDLTVYLNDQGLLTLNVPGQPDYPLTAIDEFNFAFRDLDGFAVEFENDESGNPISVLIKQPNGNFKAERKKD